MQRITDIITKVAAAVLAVVLAAGCIFEKESPMGEGRKKDVMVLLNISAKDLIQTKADDVDPETVLNTVRIYAYDQDGVQIGYADNSTANGNAFHMVLTVPDGQATETVDFYAVANEGAMTDLTYTVGSVTETALKQTMSLAELQAVLFSISSANTADFVAANGIPMSGYLPDKELNLNEGTEHRGTVGGHAPGFTLNQAINLDLTRTLAKVAVYAAEVGNATGTTTSPKIAITGITVSNVISQSSLLVPSTYPSGIVDGGYAMHSTSTSVTNTVADDAAAEVYENDANFTKIDSAYFAENPVGSSDWTKAATAGTGMVLNISYTAGGSAKTQSIYMPAIERNHFYKVLCRISAGGELLLDLEVLDWDDAEDQTIDFQDNVSLTDYGWTGGTQDAANAKLTFGSAAGQTATFNFTLETPKNGKWYATIAEGDIQNFAFVSGGAEVKTVSGNITGQEQSFTIKTLETLSLGETKSVKIRFVALTENNSRSLTVKFGTHDYYTIEQRY